MDPIVIDIGSGECRFGSAEEGRPQITFKDGQTDYLCAVSFPSEIKEQENREFQEMRYPVSRGIITNWENMEKIWYKLYSDMRVRPEDHSVLLTEAPLNPKANREKMAQIMFETFHVPSLFVGIQGAMAMYGAGHMYGIVVDSGEGVTHIVAVSTTQILINHVARLDVAGCDMTKFLQKKLLERGYTFTESMVRTIKEKLCYVALGSNEKPEKASFKLPDGNKITLQQERIQCTEMLFQPSLLGMENLGIHELIYKTIMKSPIDIRRDLFDRILPAGGNTKLPGFSERLQKELITLAPSSSKPYVEAWPDRLNFTFSGASILACLSSFSDASLSKQEYDEYGPGIINRMCYATYSQM